MKLVRRTVGVVALTSLAACQSQDLAPAEAPAPAPHQPVTPTIIEQVRNVEAPEQAPLEVESLPGGAAEGAASKFLAWGAVHSFVGSTIKNGVLISERNAMALTADNLVGVTTDGGSSWGFIRHDKGAVLAIAGKAGGPFVAVGKAGYASISSDGKTWTDLARYTNEDLTSVAVGDGAILALAKSGGVYVRYSGDGKTGELLAFADKAKAKDFSFKGGSFLANVGKVPLTSPDGNVWTPDSAPLPAVMKSFPTAQGNCTLGRVDKATGVVCEVKGQAFSAGDAVVVVQKDVFFTSKNGGTSWLAAKSPMPAVTGVVAAGGNLVAYGGAGVIATSTDGGKSWATSSTELAKAYKTHWVDGSTVILAGDGGAMARSTDGGATFTTVVTPQTGGFKQLGKLGDGRLVASLGAKGVESTDGGATWVDMVDPAPLAELVPPAKPGKCDNRVPTGGEVCTFAKAVTSPVGLPNARGVTFMGDLGFAWGDFGLVMTTSNGGAAWTARSGFPIKGLSAFEVRDSVILGVSGKEVVVSTDGGQGFSKFALPKEAGTIYGAQIAKDGGALYVFGSNGTVARAMATSAGAWQMLDLGNIAGGGKKATAQIVAVHEVGASAEAGGVLFAAGSRGELFRSDNRGDVWSVVATGTPQPIQAMTAEGQTVVAVTLADRQGGNLLLKSDDGGKHFYVARELSHQGGVDNLTLSGGTLSYRDRVSKDFGATWTKGDDRYWSGAEAVGDGSNLSFVNYTSRYVRDTVYLVGEDKDDWVIMDGVQTKLARFECGKGSGCWMLHAGQVYRPL